MKSVRLVFHKGTEREMRSVDETLIHLTSFLPSRTNVE